MRNLFDQYTQPENRLTHALAVCLDEDRELLKKFMAWLKVPTPSAARGLSIVEQSLPGDPPRAEVESDRAGLPDIVIHDNEHWCLLIESKVQARLTEDQLRRHERTLRRRGFETVRRVVLTKAGVIAPKRTTAITWSGVYEWLGAFGRHRVWPQRLRSYLRVAEVRLAQQEYLTEGTLTMFDGFPFSDDNPYTYGEAKRLLNLAMAELRQNRELHELGMDPKAPGRSAITGRSARAVWDFLSLRDRPQKGGFTGYPHLTLAVHVDHLEVAITIPNRAVLPIKRRFIDLGVDGVVALNAQILRNARGLIARGASVQAYALQRHYLGQRSPATTDAMLSFRLETSQPKNRGRTKWQPEWVELFALMPKKKRSNIQFQYRVQLPWGTKGLDSRESLQLIVNGWKALMPLLSALRSES